MCSISMSLMVRTAANAKTWTLGRTRNRRVAQPSSVDPRHNVVHQNDPVRSDLERILNGNRSDVILRTWPLRANALQGTLLNRLMTHEKVPRFTAQPSSQ